LGFSSIFGTIFLLENLWNKSMDLWTGFTGPVYESRSFVKLRPLDNGSMVEIDPGEGVHDVLFWVARMAIYGGDLTLLEALRCLKIEQQWCHVCHGDLAGDGYLAFPTSVRLVFFVEKQSGGS
jgi:hypothetical protein